MSRNWDIFINYEIFEQMKNISGSSLKLIFALSRYADKLGQCYPSIERLTSDCGLSRRSVQNSLKELQEIGLLTIQKNGVGRNNTHNYLLKTSNVKGAKSAPFKTEKGAKNDTEKVQKTTDKRCNICTRSNTSEETPKKYTPTVDNSTETDLLEKWNTFAGDCGLSQIQKITAKRKRGIHARQRDKMLDNLKTIFDKIRDSDFLLGHAGRDSWRGADFDFIFCSAENWIKILEGKYDNAKKLEPQHTSTPRPERIPEAV